MGVALLAMACGGPSAEGRSSEEEAPAIEPPRVAEEEAESVSADPAPAVIDEAPEPPEADDVEEVAALLALDGERSRSIGAPTDGRLEGGVRLPDRGPGFRSNPRRPNAEARYGTVEMVQALVRAAGVVHEDVPGSYLVLNDLGYEAGGPIARHGSHRAGRDVDVLFYLLDAEGQPWPSIGAFLDPEGHGVDFRDLADPDDDIDVYLDAPRTWRFVRALIEDPETGRWVQRIFVAEHIRALLLAEAESSRAPRETRERFEAITCQPGYPHDDHLHIRFYCTPDDMAHGCEDSPPIYPWRRVELRSLGLRPRVHRPRPDRPASPTVSAEEARAAAGAMDARVERWLERREAWMRPPRTGRPYCR